MEFLNQKMRSLDEGNLRRHLRRVEGAQGPRIRFEGRQVLNFCSNNYLGLADDPRLQAAAVQCMHDQGLGSGASRLICGNFSAHERLEQKIARFKNTERALLFSSGYLANLGIIPALFDRHDIVFSDRLNHASIIDGIILSGAQMRRYPHKDVLALEKMLRDCSPAGRKVIITDTVFSMDGDTAPLDQIVALAERYECLVMVDEAHATGVLGPEGQGAVEHFGLQGRIPIIMGTLSKAVGSFGAYCCGSETLIEFLINKARGFIYTTALPPAIAAAAYQGLEIIEQEPQRRESLWANTFFVLQGLRKMGFDTAESQTPIIPVILGDVETALDFSHRLMEAGILVTAIRPPTVPKNTARLRITVTAAHSPKDLEYLLEQMAFIQKKVCINQRS